MLSKQKKIMFISKLAALGTISLASTANAEYGYHQGYSQQQVNYQQVSYRAPARVSHYNNPPVVLPYVPFDDAQTGVENIFQPMPAGRTHSYQPPANHYPPVSRHMPAKPGLPAERQRVIAAAKRQMGIKYRWGGNTPRQGFDCSGFTKYALKKSGKKIPRTAAQQSKASRTISRSTLRPGDMIFFKTKGTRVNHVGIYLGDGKFIHAASGGGRVMIDDLRKNYWQKRLYKYGTFLS